MADVFVSYATADRERVRPLVEALEEHGHSVWWDREIDPGAAFDEAIERALNDATWVVSVWTELSISSRWVRAESMFALDRDALLPVLLDDVELPVAFRTTQAVDLRDWRPDSSDEGLSQLLARLQGTPIAPPPASHPVQSASKPTFQTLATVLILAVAAAAGVYWYIENRQTPQQPDFAELPSVGVLPFQHAGAQDEQLFADGLTDEIIQGLQQYRSFPVISRHATFAFRGSQLDIEGIADQLGTQYLVTGTVRRAGDIVRVSAVLTSATGEQMWSDSYETKFESAAIFAMQDEIAAKILGVIHPQIVVSELNRIDDKDPTDLQAWEHVLRALEIAYDIDMARVDEALGHVDAALALDPNLPMAYWARAELGVYNYMEEGLVGDAALARESEILADFQEALKISPFDGSICGCLAFTHMMRGDMPSAKAVLDSALPINPSSALLRANHGTYLLHEGDLQGARSELDVALRLDPISRYGSLAWAAKGLVEAIEGDFHSAITFTRRGQQLEREETFTQIQLPTLLLLNGERDRAEDAFVDLITSHPKLHPQNRFTYGWLAPLEAQMREIERDHDLAISGGVGDLLEAQWRDMGWMDEGTISQ